MSRTSTQPHTDCVITVVGRYFIHWSKKVPKKQNLKKYISQECSKLNRLSVVRVRLEVQNCCYSLTNVTCLLLLFTCYCYLSDTTICPAICLGLLILIFLLILFPCCLFRYCHYFLVATICLLILIFLLLPFAY